MTEKRTKKSSSKKKRKITIFLDNLNFFRLLKVLFLISLSLLIVYSYYLHTKGNFISTLALLWTLHKKVIMIIFGFVSYSLGIFYLGFRKGRNG